MLNPCAQAIVEKCLGTGDFWEWACELCSHTGKDWIPGSRWSKNDPEETGHFEDFETEDWFQEILDAIEERDGDIWEKMREKILSIVNETD